MVVFCGIALFSYLLSSLQLHRSNKSQREFNRNISANLSTIVESSTIVMEYFKEMALRKVNVDQARSLIASELEKSKLDIIINIVKTKKTNNLDDSEHIDKKVRDFVERAYENNAAMLRKFEFQGKVLAFFLENDWKNEVYRQAIKDCSNSVIDIHKLESTYRALFDKFKNGLNNKIDYAY